MAKTSHTQRTRKWLRTQGYVHIDTVEQYNAFSGKRHDLFNLFDLLVISEDGLVGYQVCGTDWQPHIRKMGANPVLVMWLASGADAYLIGWRKVLKKRGGKQKIWAPRIRDLREDPIREDELEDGS